jgi:hypothetical protein
VLAEASVEDDRLRVEQGAERGQRPPEGGGDGVDRPGAVGPVFAGFDVDNVLATVTSRKPQGCSSMIGAVTA